MENIISISKQAFYDKLTKCMNDESLTYKDLSKIIRNAKRIHKDISFSEFLRINDLICIGKKIIDLNSSIFLKKLYDFSFNSNRNGYLKHCEIREFTQHFFDTKIHSIVFEKLMKILKFKHNTIYSPITKNNFKTYAFIEKDELEVKFLFGEIDKKTYEYYKKITKGE